MYEMDCMYETLWWQWQECVELGAMKSDAIWCLQKQVKIFQKHEETLTITVGIVVLSEE